MYENSYGNGDLLDLHRKQQEEEEKEMLEKKGEMVDDKFVAGAVGENGEEGNNGVANSLDIQGSKDIDNAANENNVFDPEFATQRIKGGGSTEFGMVDVNGKPVKYGFRDRIKGNVGHVNLPEGTLVSKLGPNPNNPNYIHVIAWHKMKYREGYIHKIAFSEKYEGGIFDVEVFVDDAYHTVHRAELFLESIPENDNSVQHLRNMLSSVKNYLSLYKKGEFQITRKILDQIKETDAESLRINTLDKPDSLSRLSAELFKLTNPITNKNIKLSDTVLFIPLTDTWFKSDVKLKDHYDNVMMQSGNFNRVGGDTGEGIESSSDIKEWFDQFEVLRQLIKDRPVANSPEGKWLNEITLEDQKRTRRMIFLGGDTWGNLADTEGHYSSGVAVNTSFGPLQANPMLLLMMHELNVNTNSEGINLMGTDTHIPIDDTKSAWESANKGAFSKEVAPNSNKLDDLFQSQSAIALTMLSGYMEKIEALQSTEKK